MSANDDLKAIGKGLAVMASDAVIRGMNLTKQSARLEQLADLTTEEQAQRIIVILVREGMARYENGAYVAIGLAGDASRASDAINSDESIIPMTTKKVFTS